jgi:hypothetical protein
MMGRLGEGVKGRKNDKETKRLRDIETARLNIFLT